MVCGRWVRQSVQESKCLLHSSHQNVLDELHRKHAFLCVLQYATYLPWPCLVWSTWLCSWGPWFCIGKRTTGQSAWRSSFFIIFLSPCQICSTSRECASFPFIIMEWLTEELLWHNKELIIQRDRKTFPPREPLQDLKVAIKIRNGMPHNYHK